MGHYSYSARKLSGQLVEGQGAASSRDALAAQLSADGMILVSAKPVGSRRSKFSRRGQVKVGALVSFVREFRSLVGAGMPLAEALRRLEKRNDAVLSAAISETRKGVEQGRALDRAMAESPGVFDPLFQATVRAGVASGRLEMALDRLLSFLVMRQALENKVKKALRYPVFLLALLAVVLAILMLFVLPRFSALYEEFDASLPWLTGALIRAVETAPYWIGGTLVIMIAGWLLLKGWLRLPGARLRYDRLCLAVPAFGAVGAETGRIQVAFMLSMLLSAGVTLRDALRFTAQGITNAYQQAAVARIEERVARGQSLAASLKKETLFPDLSISLLEAGEQAGDLDRMFNEVAKLHEERLEDRLNRTLALVEPGMMLLVGLVLGTVIVAVYLPIFGISSVIQ